MGFLAPALPFVGPAFSAIGGLFGGGESAGQKQASQMLGQLTNRLMGQADQYGPFAQRFLTNANQGLGSALNFWAPLLSGSRTAMSSVFAPDVNRINEQYQGILDATRGSRTGAGASIYAQAPYEKQAQIQSIFQAGRPQAAQAMQNLGGQFGTLGGNTLSSIFNALGQAIGGATEMGTRADTAYGQEATAGEQFGTALSDIMRLLGPILEKKGGS